MFDGWKVLEVVNKFGHVHIGTEDFAVAEREIEDDVFFVNGSDCVLFVVFKKNFTRNNDFSAHSLFLAMTKT